jgi:hypothetical protein
MHYQQQLQ